VRNYSNTPEPARQLNVELLTLDKKQVNGAQASVDVPALQPGEERVVSVSIPVSNPAKWTAETPNL
jgi:beta-galactosidase